MALTRPSLAQLSSTVSTVTDPLSVLNKDSVAANIDVGFIFNRDGGISSNIAVIWQESTDQIVLGLTPTSGAINSNITISGYANVRAGYFIGDGSQLTGLPESYGNTQVAAYLNTNAYSPYSNVNVAVYTNLSTYAWTANVTSANLGMQGYVDAVTTAWSANAYQQQALIGNLVASGYSNVNVAAYLPSYNHALSASSIQATAIGNVTAGSGAFTTLTATSTVSGTGFNNLFASPPTIGSSSPAPATFTSVTAGSVNAAIVGNVGATIIGSGNQLSALPGYAYSNVNIKAYTDTMGYTNYSNVNVVAYIQTGLSTVTANITSSQNATLYNNGALIVSGGVGIAKDLWVAGNIYASNIIATTLQILTIQSPLIYLVSNAYPYNFDIGFYGHFIGGSGNTYQHTGFVRENSDSIWRLFSNVADPIGGQVSFTNAIYDDLMLGNINSVGNILARGAVVSSSTVNGNESVTGYLNVTGNVVATGGVFNQLTVNGNESVTGYLNVTGNILTQTANVSQIGVANSIKIGGFIANASGNTGAVGQYLQSTATGFAWGTPAGGGGGTPGGGNGQLQFNSSSAFAGTASLYYFAANGAIVANADIASTSTTTGTMQITGGVGISGNVWADRIHAVNNGNGTNFRVGDDLWLGDINVANTMRLMGQQDNTQAFIRFGNTNASSLGVSGSGPLSWGGVLNVTGNVLGATASFGSINSTGFINTSGNVSGAVVNTGALNVTGTSTVAAVTSTGFINTSANVSAAIGLFGSLTSTGFINTSANVSAAIGSFNSITVREAVTAIANGGTSGVGNIGATGATFNTVFAKATTAQYADLAEVYTSDQSYPAGTVVVFDGESEVTQSHSSHDTRIAGVVSTNPAYLMNHDAVGVPVALQGRVPCRILGPVSKGDRVVSSHIAGVAQALDPAQYQPGCIIGKALQAIDSTDISVIEVVVGRL